MPRPLPQELSRVLAGVIHAFEQERRPPKTAAATPTEDDVHDDAHSVALISDEDDDKVLKRVTKKFIRLWWAQSKFNKRDAFIPWVDHNDQKTPQPGGFLPGSVDDLLAFVGREEQQDMRKELIQHVRVMECQAQIMKAAVRGSNIDKAVKQSASQMSLARKIYKTEQNRDRAGTLALWCPGEL